MLGHGRWFSPGTPASSTTKNWSPWYIWNIAESDVKHQKTKPNYNCRFNVFISCHKLTFIKGLINKIQTFFREFYYFFTWNFRKGRKFVIWTSTKKHKKLSFIMHNVNFCTKIMNTVFREILVFGGNRSTHYLSQI